jgi:hypothetical protein
MFEPMRYAALFGLLGTTLGLAAAQTAAGGAAGVAWVLIGAEVYVALCLFTMAAAYGLNDRGISLEGAFGHRGWRRGLDLLLLPYRLLARLVFGLLRRLDPMDLMHPVGARLYVGRLPLPADHRRLSEAGVTSVLNLCAEFPRLSRLDRAAGLSTAYVPVLDGAAPSDRQFRGALDWISARYAEGHSILIHCAQGRGRSVTIAAAALCRLGLAAGPDEALAQITAARPRARPSRRQRAALARFLAGPEPSPQPITR